VTVYPAFDIMSALLHWLVVVDFLVVATATPAARAKHNPVETPTSTRRLWVAAGVESSRGTSDCVSLSVAPAFSTTAKLAMAVMADGLRSVR